MSTFPAIRPLPSEALAAMLQDAHQRTVELVQGIEGDDLFGPYMPIVNPLLWEVGHIGWFHEHFILRGLDRAPPLLQGADELYDSMKVAHETRWGLPLPSIKDTLDYLRQVLNQLLARLSDGEASEQDTYHVHLTTFHEDMHGEAFLWTRQTLAHPVPLLTGPGRPSGATAGPLQGDVEIPSCTHVLGAIPVPGPFVFDNEKWGHRVSVDAFQIARAPVTNEEFAAFVDDGGYQRRRWWTDAGWEWRMTANAEHPVYWLKDGSRWTHRRFKTSEGLPPHQPVVHVNFHEAQAYCRWAGRRLPTEVEWEVASSRKMGGAAMNPNKRRYPWGPGKPTQEVANLDGYALGCLDVAALPESDSAFGCRQMLGNVWEWTSSLFQPFPEFTPDPYEDYSKPWFAEGRRVLKGGSWATRARLISNGYRNFFTPDRRDIFAGFRTCPR